MNVVNIINELQNALHNAAVQSWHQKGKSLAMIIPARFARLNHIDTYLQSLF